MLVHWLAPGGMEAQALELAEGLACRGHEVTMGFFRTAHLDLAQAAAPDVKIVRLGRPSRVARMAAAPSIARMARSHDVVHCTGWDASLWGRLGGILGRRPVVVTDHSADREIHVSQSGRSRAGLMAWHNRVLSPLTYATVAVAARQLEVLAEEGVDLERVVVIPNRVVVIPNGVSLDRVRDQARTPVDRASLGIPDDAKVVIHVARWGEMKRQHLTYEAVRAVREELGDVHVLFAGRTDDGTLLSDAQQRAEQEGATWAHFLGVRDDVPALLALSDLAVLPSSAEALPMSIIEGMAMGVPQVASDVGDIPALLQDTGAGIVFPAGDPAAFTQACRAVLGDDALAARLGEAGRQASQRFDATTMVDRYVELFEAAATGAPVPRS
jgi:glycosyltransferase involved in cell wall biosynthesis